MSGLALFLLAPLIFAHSAGTQSVEECPVSQGAVCGRWEACQAAFRQAGQAIRNGDYRRADRWLQHIQRRMPEPYCHWAAEQRRLLDAALHPQAIVEATPDLPNFDDLFKSWEMPQRVETPAPAIDDPFAPAPHRPIAASQQPAESKAPPSPLPEAPLTLTLRLARVCRGLRDFRSAADLYIRGIDAGELPAAAVLTELLDCLARCGAADEEFTKLAQLAALEGTFDRFAQAFDIALRHRDMLLRPALPAGDRQMEMDINAGRNPTAGRDRLEFLQRFRAFIRTDDERLRFYNAMSQALRQISDDEGCHAWEEKLLAEFLQFGDPCTAILVRRGERLLAMGNPAGAIAEFRRATKLAPWTRQGQRARHQLGELLQQRGHYQAAISELTRLVPPPMIDDEDGELITMPSGDGGLSAALTISECYESLNEPRHALKWAEIAAEIEASDGQLRGNWSTLAADRVVRLRQKLGAVR